jgi:hypothetical protein
MRKIALFAALFAAAVSPAAAAGTGNICLHTRDIDRTKVIDAKTILFIMKDGKVWRNTLLGPCPGLRFNGFVYVTHDEQICGNNQAIHVLRSYELCLLGPFTRETSPNQKP